MVVRDRRTGRERTLTAPYFLDATELGDLLPLAGVEFVDRRRGRRPRPASRTPPARTSPATSRRSPAASRSITSTARTTPSTGPPSTPSGATTSPTLKPAWPGRLLDLTYADPITLKPVNRGFDPRGAGRRALGLPADRRPPQLPARRLSRQPGSRWSTGRRTTTGSARSSAPGSRPRTPDGTSRGPSSSACRCSTGSRPNAPGPTASTGWKGLRLRPDLVGTEDGLAKAPYIRESRRIQAEFTVLEQHVGTEARRQALEAGRTSQAEPFADSVGVGSYRIDLHPSTGGDNYIDISSLPFQIPLGRPDPAPGREPAAGLQEPGDDPHHQRLLPPASGRVGHRRGRRRAGGVLPGAQGIAPGRPEHAQTPGRVPGAPDRPGRRDRLAAADAALGLRGEIALTITGKWKSATDEHR